MLPASNANMLMRATTPNAFLGPPTLPCDEPTMSLQPLEDVAVIFAICPCRDSEGEVSHEKEGRWKSESQERNAEEL